MCVVMIAHGRHAEVLRKHPMLWPWDGRNQSRYVGSTRRITHHGEAADRHTGPFDRGGGRPPVVVEAPASHVKDDPRKLCEVGMVYIQSLSNIDCVC